MLIICLARDRISRYRGYGLDHLLLAGLVGPAAFGVFAGEDAGFLVAQGTGAGG